MFGPFKWDQTKLKWVHVKTWLLFSWQPFCKRSTWPAQIIRTTMVEVGNSNGFCFGICVLCFCQTKHHIEMFHTERLSGGGEEKKHLNIRRREKTLNSQRFIVWRSPRLYSISCTCAKLSLLTKTLHKNMYYDFWPVINVVKVCWLGSGTKTTQLG